MYHVAGIYIKVSSDYIIKALTEWSRIANVAGKNKDAIEADRKKVFELCIEAGSGIKKVLESGDKTFPAKRKAIGKKQNKDEL